MTDEPGSDAALRALRPKAMDLINKRIEADEDRWAEEQDKVDEQPIEDDPGLDYPEREPIT